MAKPCTKTILMLGSALPAKTRTILIGLIDRERFTLSGVVVKGS